MFKCYKWTFMKTPKHGVLYTAIQIKWLPTVLYVIAVHFLFKALFLELNQQILINKKISQNNY